MKITPNTLNFSNLKVRKVDPVPAEAAKRLSLGAGTGSAFLTLRFLSAW